MPSRRTFLAASAAALAAGVAGCGETPPPPADEFDRPDDRWPTAGYDPAGTSHPPAGPDGATEQWTTAREQSSPPLYGELSTPIVGEEAVYVATLADWLFRPDDHENVLAALDAESGEVAWTVGFPQGLTGGPALVGDVVVVGGRDGAVHAVRDGSVVWRTELGARVGTPTVYGDRVYVPDRRGNLHALGRDGGKLWTVDRVGTLEALFGDDEPLEVGVPAADGAGVVATFQDPDGASRIAHLIAYDHAGEERWHYEMHGRDGGIEPRGPAIADGAVYATAGGDVHAVDAETGDRRWRFVTGYRTAGPPATDGERVFVAAKNLYALDAVDGTERWRVVDESLPERHDLKRGVPYLGRPAVADGAVYVRAGAVDAATGGRLWGDEADEWLAEGDYADDVYTDQPLAKLAATAESLYLSHGVRGVKKYA